MRRPADLPFDLLDELLDPAGGGERLLALELDQSVLALTVREEDLERAARDERAADEDDEEENVLAKEPAAAADVLRAHGQTLGTIITTVDLDRMRPTSQAMEREDMFLDRGHLPARVLFGPAPRVVRQLSMPIAQRELDGPEPRHLALTVGRQRM